MFDPPVFFHHVTQKYPSGISPGPCFSHEVNGYFSSPMDGHETDPQTLHWNYTSMQRQKSWDWWIFIMFIPVYPSISALLKLALLQTLEVAVELKTYCIWWKETHGLKILEYQQPIWHQKHSEYYICLGHGEHDHPHCMCSLKESFENPWTHTPPNLFF